MMNLSGVVSHVFVVSTWNFLNMCGGFSLSFTPGTSSIDTTCTIWGLETGQVLGRVNLVSGHVKTQLIAHDKEVTVHFSPFLFSFPFGHLNLYN